MIFYRRFFMHKKRLRGESSVLSEVWVYNERGEAVCNLSAWIIEAKNTDRLMKLKERIGQDVEAALARQEKYRRKKAKAK